MEYEIAARYISPSAAPLKELAVEDNQIFSEIVNRFPNFLRTTSKPALGTPSAFGRMAALTMQDCFK